MDPLRNAAQCFIDNTLESNLMEYLMGQSYMQTITTMLETDFTDFDSLMNAMDIYCGGKNDCFTAKDMYSARASNSQTLCQEVLFVFNF